MLPGCPLYQCFKNTSCRHCIYKKKIQCTDILFNRKSHNFLTTWALFWLYEFLLSSIASNNRALLVLLWISACSISFVHRNVSRHMFETLLYWFVSLCTNFVNCQVNYCSYCKVCLWFCLHFWRARHCGVEVAGWTVDWVIWVLFPAYPHRMWALWWQGG